MIIILIEIMKLSHIFLFCWKVSSPDMMKNDEIFIVFIKRIYKLFYSKSALVS